MTGKLSSTRYLRSDECLEDKTEDYQNRSMLHNHTHTHNLSSTCRWNSALSWFLGSVFAYILSLCLRYHLCNQLQPMSSGLHSSTHPCWGWTRNCWWGWWESGEQPPVGFVDRAPCRRFRGVRKESHGNSINSSINPPGGRVVPTFLLQKRYANSTACQLPMSVTLIVGRRLMTIEWQIRQYNVNIQWFEHAMVSVRSTWQCTHGAWLIDTPPRMVSLRLTPRSAMHL